MTDWATVADIGTAAGTVVLAVIRQVRSRKTRVARRRTFAVTSLPRFVLLPDEDVWRCDATRYWSLPASAGLRDFGFS